MANIEHLRRFVQDMTRAVEKLGRDARGLKTTVQFGKGKIWKVFAILSIHATMCLHV